MWVTQPCVCCCLLVPALGALLWTSLQESEPPVLCPWCPQELASPNPGMVVLWLSGKSLCLAFNGET